MLRVRRIVYHLSLDWLFPYADQVANFIGSAARYATIFATLISTSAITPILFHCRLDTIFAVLIEGPICRRERERFAT